MSVLLVGGRGELDTIAARMLAQVLEAKGARAQVAGPLEVMPARLRQVPLAEIDTAVIDCEAGNKNACQTDISNATKNVAALGVNIAKAVADC